MDNNSSSVATLHHIRYMMERSSRFISLSGLSGVTAGVLAFAGAWIARGWLESFSLSQQSGSGVNALPASWLIFRLSLLALVIFTGSVVFAVYFTWKKTKRNGLPIWDHSSKKLLVNLLIPLMAGAIFILGLVNLGYWNLVAPASLIFYGLALVNASKYTLGDIRYLGLLEISLGIWNMFYPGHSLNFWAVGFGVLHIFYGLMMWWKYDQCEGL